MFQRHAPRELAPMQIDNPAQAEAERIKSKSQQFWGRCVMKRYIELNRLINELREIEDQGGGIKHKEEERDRLAVELLGMLYGMGAVDIDQLMSALMEKLEEA